MDEEWQRKWADLQRRASEVEQQLLPGMSVGEARAIVARHPGLSLRVVNADNPIMTADLRFGRIDVYARDGFLVSPDST